MAFGDNYQAGTVSLDDGSPQDKTIVRGSGTLWSAFGILPGDRFEYAGASISIAEVIDDVTLKLAYEWPFDDFADAANYAIAQVSAQRVAALNISNSLSDIRDLLRIYQAASPIFAIKEYGISEMPVDAVVNDRFVVAASGATGDLAGKGNQIVTKLETGLYFNEPSFGWHIVSQIDGSGSNVVRNWDGTEWSTVGALATVPKFLGAWDDATAYTAGNIVTRLNKLYIATQSGADKEPESNADYWDALLDIGAHGGGVVIQYVFKTSTTDTVADTQGQVNANAALGSTPTVLRVNKLDITGADFSTWLAAIGTASTSAVKGKARLLVIGDTGKQFLADVTAVTAQASRYDLTISSPLPVGTIADDASVLFFFDPKGDKGDIGNTGNTGPTGPHGGPIAIPLIFDGTSTGDADPGDGKFRLGSATQNEATMLRLSLKNSDGADITALLDSVADYTGSPKLMLSLRHKTTPTTKYLTATASAVASATGRRNWTIAVVGYSAASPFADADAAVLSWIPLQKGDQGNKGDKGDQGNPFTPDHVVATFAGRAAYDEAAAMTSVLVEDDATHSDRPTLYFLLTPAVESPATAAVWSSGFEFSTAAAASAIAFTPAGRITSENVQDALEELDGLTADQFEQPIPDVASAATVDLSATISKTVRITGTTGITAITMRNNQLIFVRWMAAGTITDNGTSLILNRGTRTNQVGTWSAFVANSDATAVREVFYSGITLDTDTTLAANSDARIPSQKAVKAYADALLDAVNGWQIKNVALDCSANPNYPAASAGWAYVVSVAGKIGGASGKTVEVGDIALCLVDSSASGDQATVGANWTILQANLVGAVVGPSSVTDNSLARWDGITGKLLKNGAVIGADVQAFDARLSSVMPQNSKTASFSFALTDGAGHVYLSGSTSAQTATIPANASVAFPVGTVITIVNNSSQDWSIAITSDTLVWSPSGTTGTRTLASKGMCTLLKVTSTGWFISGVGLT